ncbi:hypothetical protein LTR92_010648 [Exophiala xenobiotica]|nr:hypothetical protein LTR92_010648 [Exophiala xenobiotica]KAK5440983.1 hypothetical protein LTR18_006826 [Exophiala xenobiotica]
MPEHDILLALSTARRLAAIILGRPATDDSEALKSIDVGSRLTPSLTRFPLRQMLPLNVPFAPLGPASGNPPPPPPPPMPTSTNEGGEEDDDDDDEDDEEDNDVNDVTEAAQQSNPGVDASGRPKRMLKETRAKFNKRRLEYAAQHPDDAGAQNAAKVAIRNQQSVEARKVSRKEKKKEKRKAAKK